MKWRPQTAFFILAVLIHEASAYKAHDKTAQASVFLRLLFECITLSCYFSLPDTLSVCNITLLYALLILLVLLLYGFNSEEVLQMLSLGLTVQY